MVLKSARISTSRKLSALDVPADHPFAISTYAAAASNKGSKNDRRRVRAKALKLIAKVSP
jgi:hypothetical protein